MQVQIICESMDWHFTPKKTHHVVDVSFVFSKKTKPFWKAQAHLWSYPEILSKSLCRVPKCYSDAFFTLFQQKIKPFCNTPGNPNPSVSFPFNKSNPFCKSKPNCGTMALWIDISSPQKKHNHVFDVAQFSAKCQNHFVEFSSLLRFKKHLESSTGHPRSLQIGFEGFLEISTWHPWAYQVTTQFIVFYICGSTLWLDHVGPPSK